jgi:hypothetical protein
VVVWDPLARISVTGGFENRHRELGVLCVLCVLGVL